MEKIIIASKNKGKIKEFAKLLEGYDVKSLLDINFDEEIEETGTTFKENALIKASYICKKYNTIALSDDSGLEVFSLNNEPGVYSARYAGECHDDEANNNLLLKNLKDKDNTDCRYVCAIVVCYPDGRTITVEDYCYGKIIFERKGTNGFGYDPYFYLEQYGKTMAEISMEEKNKISHRGKAIQKLIGALDEINNS